MSSTSKGFMAVIAALAVFAALVAIGSTAYLIAEGETRSPATFRELVAAEGLEVDWLNNGPRSGSGHVDAECGQILISVDEIQDELWVRWSDRRETISEPVVQQILACDL